MIYEPFGKIGITQIQGSGVMIPLDYNCAEGNDHIKAVYKDLNMEFSDIILCQDENIYNEEMQVWENKKREVFKGQWLICDLGRELSAQVSLFQGLVSSVLSVQIPLKRAMRFLINILRSVLMMGRKFFTF